MEIVAIVLVLLFCLFAYRAITVDRKSAVRKQNLESGIITGNSRPDKPMNFPAQAVWFSVKSESALKVAQALGLTSVVITNWESGLDLAQENNCVFVTPPIDGWVLATGLDLPKGNTSQSYKQVAQLLKGLSKDFGETYFFAGVMDYYCWAKSGNGAIQRLYAYSGNTEEFRSLGYQLGIERNYKLVEILPDDIPEEDQDYWSRNDITHPDMELLEKIVEDWNIAPTKLKGRTDLAGTGYAGVVSHDK